MTLSWHEESRCLRGVIIHHVVVIVSSPISIGFVSVLRPFLLSAPRPDPTSSFLSVQSIQINSRGVLWLLLWRFTHHQTFEGKKSGWHLSKMGSCSEGPRKKSFNRLRRQTLQSKVLGCRSGLSRSSWCLTSRRGSFFKDLRVRKWCLTRLCPPSPVGGRTDWNVETVTGDSLVEYFDESTEDS